MKKIDLSNIRSGKEFAEIIFNNPNEICFMLTGEENNPILNKMSEPEYEPKFKIRDMVRLDKELSDFNGISNDDIYTIVGMEECDNQFLYTVRNSTNEYKFFGYELEKC